MTIKSPQDIDASYVHIYLTSAIDRIECVRRYIDQIGEVATKNKPRRRTPTITGKQCQTLIRHFDSRESISPMEAWTMYGVRCLHRRILDLEANGWKFRRERRVDPTGQRYVRYFLIEKGAQ